MNNQKSETGPYLLEVNNLEKTYHPAAGSFKKSNPVRALRDVSFTISRGKTLGLIGMSGSGKTTVARCVLKLTELNRGKIFFSGKDITGLSYRRFLEYRKRMQIVFQDSGSVFNPRFTAGETLRETLSFHNTFSQSDYSSLIAEVLSKVGLSADLSNRYPHELSSGQRQRLGIARALAVNPSLLICDEPVSSLDLSVQAQIMNLFLDLQEQQELTYLFISHDLSVIRLIADQIAVMYRGFIVERAGKNEWFHNPLHPYSLSLIALAGSSLPMENLSSPSGCPEPEHQFPGCVFYNRCGIRKPVCRDHMPAETEILPGRYIRCYVAAGT